MKKLIEILGLRFEVIQYKWGRKLFKGEYYLIYNQLPMNIFWSDKLITSCGGKALETEIYE